MYNTQEEVKAIVGKILSTVLQKPIESFEFSETPQLEDIYGEPSTIRLEWDGNFDMDKQTEDKISELIEQNVVSYENYGGGKGYYFIEIAIESRESREAARKSKRKKVVEVKNTMGLKKMVETLERLTGKKIVLEARKVTHQLAGAFNRGEKRSVSNTNTDGNALFLHGNKIAEKREDGLWITNCGWQTNVTKERLNGLPGVNIQQKNYAWFLNGKKWNGEWVNVAAWNKGGITENKKPAIKKKIIKEEVSKKTLQKYLQIIQSGHIEEGQIIHLRSFINNISNDDPAGEKAKQLIFDALADSEGLTISPEQSQKGYNFLMNQWKTEKSKERKNNPFGRREQEVMENFSYFEFYGLYNAGNAYRNYYLPVYNVVAKGGSSFEYYYDGKVNIVG